jgi:hypothetical protein
MEHTSILWRRLDSPGHDACRLVPQDSGWQLEGVAVFLHDTGPAQVFYRVQCDLGWRTRQGEVHGWVGARPVSFRIARTLDGQWVGDESVAVSLEACVDLDFGFTPATNLLQLRRVALDVGQSAEVPVVWRDLPANTLRRLDQRYERRTETTYWYEAPAFGYAAMLQVHPSGFIEDYPGLWQVERVTTGEPA